eukprot:Protomagalhaensia_sp_Gyna_25__5909@NODE_89_length_5350_cov_55_762003_g69_i0_p2_GENE_NODE_89_length_5350_cov_55_762003_g69_i0NODE_89_length_5350_cov_55_762003_g69_i0_p2_ORF_typecomplete_len330_score24_15zfCCCH/PF00642_24/4_5e08zfCCCH/PF00642_24/0_012zfCCCH/PF00642_24/7_4e05zfCCCH_3/PF15663_5/2_9e11zfCCCH_3/PF15663_5/0_012Torus/PF16131_5/3_2e05Torus/PF16131_5/1_4e02Torus/PF16131_5/0_32zf_CCCH_4/PF18345_1/0_0002zf_CCCH_4/PF18345_1/11zf_CCCH_4/PF18345_1/1_4e02zf_CCCH_4/PF18345_1/12zfCCCH_4/PF18044_1
MRSQVATPPPIYLLAQTVASAGSYNMQRPSNYPGLQQNWPRNNNVSVYNRGAHPLSQQAKLPSNRDLGRTTHHGDSSTGGESGDEQSCNGRFYKTRLCLFFQKGACIKGTSCSYAHSEQELRPAPDLIKTRLCQDWINGSCTSRSCKFAHGRHELRFTHDYYKTKICHFWQQSGCTKGALCRHAHGAEELRPPPTTTAGSSVSSSCDSPQWQSEASSRLRAQAADSLTELAALQLMQQPPLWRGDNDVLSSTLSSTVAWPTEEDPLSRSLTDLLWLAERQPDLLAQLAAETSLTTPDLLAPPKIAEDALLPPDLDTVSSFLRNESLFNC